MHVGYDYAYIHVIQNRQCYPKHYFRRHLMYFFQISSAKQIFYADTHHLFWQRSLQPLIICLWPSGLESKQQKTFTNEAPTRLLRLFHAEVEGKSHQKFETQT